MSASDAISQLAQEHAALTSGCGFVDVSNRTKLVLRGADRAKVLHNFCTNDIKRLQPGESCEAFVCNLKGHVLGHIAVLCTADALLIDSVPEQGAKLAAHFDRYIIREDAQIVDRSSELAAFLVPDTFSKTLDETIPVDFLAVPSRVLWCSPEQRDAVRAKLLDAELRECSFASLEVARIEHGFPWYGVDATEENLAQELDRDEKTISFTKGCYLGQETIARLSSLGHTNRILRRVLFDGVEVPPHGAEIHAGEKVVATITSACFSLKHNRPLALAMVRRGYETPGAILPSAFGPAQVIRSDKP